MPFKVLEGGKGQPGFVCPWCGHKAMTRDDLALHWAENTQCRNNRNTNNPRQEKYTEPSEE